MDYEYPVVFVVRISYSTDFSVFLSVHGSLERPYIGDLLAAGYCWQPATAACRRVACPGAPAAWPAGLGTCCSRTCLWICCRRPGRLVALTDCPHHHHQHW